MGRKMVEEDPQKEESDAAQGDIDGESWEDAVRRARTVAVGQTYRRLEALLWSWRSVWSEIRKRS